MQMYYDVEDVSFCEQRSFLKTELSTLKCKCTVNNKNHKCKGKPVLGRFTCLAPLRAAPEHMKAPSGHRLWCLAMVSLWGRRYLATQSVWRRISTNKHMALLFIKKTLLGQLNQAITMAFTVTTLSICLPSSKVLLFLKTKLFPKINSAIYIY